MEGTNVTTNSTVYGLSDFVLNEHVIANFHNGKRKRVTFKSISCSNVVLWKINFDPYRSF